MQWWTSTTGSIELQMTAEQAASVNHSGPCDDDVQVLSEDPAIIKQLAEIKDETMREVLDEYGAWDEEQLSNRDDNIQRLLWIAGCDIDDNTQE